MEKKVDAFRTISEAADELDLPPHVLRFWETRFPQIKPLKRGGGRRYYRPVDIELLQTIRTFLYDQGYTIKGVQRLLQEQGPRGCILAAGRLPQFAEQQTGMQSAEATVASDEPLSESASYQAQDTLEEDPLPSPLPAPAKDIQADRQSKADGSMNEQISQASGQSADDFDILRVILKEIRICEDILATALSK